MRYLADLLTSSRFILSIILILFFLGLGVYELIKKRSIKKVDPRLTWLPLPLALMTLTYFLFDKVWILNVRPNGSGEPSFPSTHVMIVATIFFCASAIAPPAVSVAIRTARAPRAALRAVLAGAWGLAMASRRMAIDLLDLPVKAG